MPWERNNNNEERKEKMVAIINEKVKKESRFIDLLERFKQAVKGGQETEASIIRLDILANYGVWVG